MKLFVTLALLILVVVGSSRAAIAAPAVPAKMCPEIFQPVCGLLDGKRATYGNKCEADNAGATILHPGKCEAASVCIEMYKPVCAIDPVTKKEKEYSNLCFAELANALLVHDGKCGDK